MKAYTKTLVRIFKNNFGRFTALAAIIILGVAFMTGLGGIAPTLKTKGNEYYSSEKVADILIKSKNQTGFTDTELESVKSRADVEDVVDFTSLDLSTDDGYIRVYFMPFSEMSFNKITLVDGKLPENENEVVIERDTLTYIDRNIGDNVEINSEIRNDLFGVMSVKRVAEIVGIVQNPLFFSKEPEPAVTAAENPDENLVSVFYFNVFGDEKDYLTKISREIPYVGAVEIPVPLTSTDAYVKISCADSYDIFSEEYEKFILDKKVALLSENFSEDTAAVLTLEENKSFAMYKINIERIWTISAIFPVFFVAVSALVGLTTMTRLAEKERTAIGCQRTLGYGSFSILLKYLLFAAVCCFIGFFAGLVIGSLVITPAIYQGYSVLFYTLSITPMLYWKFGSIAASAIFAVILCVTSYIILKSLRETPSDLLRHKAPKPGKKVFLERIPFLWNRISFKYKSTLRNILRQVKHFLMTVVSVMGSTALVLAGLALRDAAALNARTNSGMGRASDSIILISFVIIFCAALLEMLIIYNLTNINIEERKREIATLKVLGYKDGEVTGYIFREVFIMSLIGTLLGLPVGCLIIDLIFTYIEFGALADIQWFSWLGAVALSLIFTLFVDLLLRRKITRTDMNASLKTVE